MEDNSDKENALSFDDIVVPETEIQDNPVVEDNSDKENALSFDDIVVPETEIQDNPVMEDNSDKENTLSFDDIEAPEIENPEDSVIEDGLNIKNTLSFDDIEAPEIENPEDSVIEDGLNIKNNLSFDDIEAPEIENPEDSVIEDGLNIKNNLSFDDIEAPEMENPEDSVIEDGLNIKNNLSFDDIEAPEIENPEDSVIEDGLNIKNNLSFDDIEVPDTENSEEPLIINNTLSADDSDITYKEGNTFSHDFNNGENNNFEPIETPQKENESFGKNLLENLNEESMNDVIIEGVNEVKNEELRASSDYLLAQIDEVLGYSNQADNDQPLNEGEEDVDRLDVLYDEQAKINSENELDEISDFNENNINTDDISDETDIQPSERLPEEPPAKKTADKKTMIAAAVLFTVLASLSAIVYLKPKDNTKQSVENLLSNDLLKQETEAPADTNTETNSDINNNNDTDNILETIAPQEIKTEQTQQVDKSTLQEMKNNNIKKPALSGAGMTVSKIAWDAPSSVSSNPQMQAFLKSAGKSIKLSLSTDLLLASEYAYTNLVKVSVNIAPSGNIEQVKILSSSGSTEIDNIVLQSVNDTLKVVKPSSNATLGQSQQLTLIIYF